MGAQKRRGRADGDVDEPSQGTPRRYVPPKPDSDDWVDHLFYHTTRLMRCWPLFLVTPLFIIATNLLTASLTHELEQVSKSKAKTTTTKATTTRNADLSFFGGGALQSFSQAHNTSLLWGTYRPGVYFGLRSRTYPTGLVAGLMWSSTAADGARTLRHKCEQDGVEQYGFSMHDGRSFGVQPIVDRGNRLALETSYVRTEDSSSGLADGGGWAARIEGSVIEGVAPREQIIIFYLASESPTVGGGHLANEEPPPFLDEAAAHLSGHVASLGDFAVLASARKGTDANATRAKVHVWGTADGNKDHLHLEDLVASTVWDSRGGHEPSKKPPGTERTKTMPDHVAAGSHLITLQVVATPPFVIDILFVPHGCGSDEQHHACKEAHDRFTGRGLTNVLSSKRAGFEQQLQETLLGNGLRLRGEPLSSDAQKFAAHSLSALLGSMGFFYGSSLIAKSGGGEPEGRTQRAPLLAVVPSRPFFPRGFLWDEGFHQLLVSAWDPALSDDIFAGWMGLMHKDGWIPREQILGAEAMARVPSEFLAQHREHANPPALLLRIQRLLDAPGNTNSPDAAGAAVRPIFREMWPWLVNWHQWFLRTQAGELPNSFRWRGRDAADGRLNAMTLASGLDDYPRATRPSTKERHVDLHSWVAFFTRMLSQLAARLDMPDEANAYAAQLEVLMRALVELHWDEKVGAFCDHGKHANAGKFVHWYVVKCASRDGSSQIEHTVANPNRPTCPTSHPQFLFPLGDGKGGLLTRERMLPRGEREQFVEHLGYVSLFPLLLKLLPPESPQLLPLIELVRDPERLWSAYGVRSLSLKDAWYGRQNAPGDEPYWRGPIWINLNYLLLGGLKHYASVAGPAQHRAATVYAELRENLVGNMLDEWKRTGYLWEQYDPESGVGQRTHPFNGWSSLAALALAEIY